MHRSMLTLCGLVLLGLAVSVALRSSSAIGRYVGDSPAAARLLHDDRSPAASAGVADLTVVVFTDYRCPACRMADPALRAAAARDGNLRIVYKDWPIFGEPSETAARAALAADRQGIYVAVHHALMQAPALDETALRRAVVAAGGDWRELQADLDRYAVAIERALARNREEAFVLGLAGTPGYLIGPILVEDALTESEFSRAFEQARSRQRSAS